MLALVVERVVHQLCDGVSGDPGDWPRATHRPRWPCASSTLRRTGRLSHPLSPLRPSGPVSALSLACARTLSAIARARRESADATRGRRLSRRGDCRDCGALPPAPTFRPHEWPSRPTATGPSCRRRAHASCWAIATLSTPSRGRAMDGGSRAAAARTIGRCAYGRQSARSVRGLCPSRV